jgi:hypothetical protein
MSQEHVRELLQACRNFSHCVEAQKLNEPLLPTLRAWEAVYQASVRAGAPAELVEAVARPHLPFADGLSWVNDRYRARLLGTVAALIAWCEKTLSGNNAPSSTAASDKGIVGHDDGLALIPGGFTYAGSVHNLTGRPRDMLRALLDSRHRRCTAAELREKLAVDDDLGYPEVVVRDTAKRLRRALRKAAEQAGRPISDPLPSHGTGKDLAYELALA